MTKSAENSYNGEKYIFQKGYMERKIFTNKENIGLRKNVKQNEYKF